MKNVDLLHLTVAHVGEMQSYFHTKKNLTSQLLPRLENQHTLKKPLWAKTVTKHRQKPPMKQEFGIKYRLPPRKGNARTTAPTMHSTTIHEWYYKHV